MKIAFLDLNHVTKGIHTNTVPLGCGIISAYLSKNIVHDLDIKIYKDPHKALNQLIHWGPDILGLAQYSWNSELNLYVAEVIKEKFPDCVVIAGGPNLFLSKPLKEEFLKENNIIDCCVTFDGEIPMYEIVSKKISGMSNEEIRRNPPPGIYALHPDNNELVESTINPPRLDSLDFTGSFYADGVFDEMLDDGYHPFVQTHRGCPFTCSFCHTSDHYYSKMLFSSPELFKKDMEYLGKRFEGKSNITLYIANTNMSLFKEDFAIAQIIKETKEKYNWPQVINVNSGKDPKKLLEMLSIIDYQPAIALQTLTPEVLKNIKRKNIPFEKFIAFQHEVASKTGVPSATELILSLPGETKQTFTKTLRTVMNSGIKNIVIYTLMKLRGTPLASDEITAEFGYKTKHRIVPRQFSRINNRVILDTEEVVVSTDALPYKDYLELRGMSFIITIFFSSAELNPLKQFLMENDIDIAQWIFNINDKVKKVGDLYSIYEDFIQESHQELFPSLESLHDFFDKPENYEALLEGKYGDNLLRKYKCIALSNHFQSIIDLAISEARNLFNQMADSPVPERLFDDLSKFLMTRELRRYFIDDVKKERQKMNLSYDIVNWLKDNTDQVKLTDLSGDFKYTVTTTEKARVRFQNLIEMNKDLELSVQILYRDGLTMDFWPIWES